MSTPGGVGISDDLTLNKRLVDVFLARDFALLPQITRAVQTFNIVDDDNAATAGVALKVASNYDGGLRLNTVAAGAADTIVLSEEGADAVQVQHLATSVGVALYYSVAEGLHANLTAITGGVDGYIRTVGGRLLLVSHVASPSATALYLDDDAADAAEKILFVDPSDASRTQTTEATVEDFVVPGDGSGAPGTGSAKLKQIGTTGKVALQMDASDVLDLMVPVSRLWNVEAPIYVNAVFSTSSTDADATLFTVTYEVLTTPAAIPSTVNDVLDTPIASATASTTANAVQRTAQGKILSQKLAWGQFLVLRVTLTTFAGSAGECFFHGLELSYLPARFQGGRSQNDVDEPALETEDS